MPSIQHLALIGMALLASCSSATTTDSAATNSSGPRSPTPTTVVGAETAQVATVTRVVDGDTIDVNLSGQRERIRLIGIDTPESVKPDSVVECYGVAASQHLSELLPAGTEVELVRDAELRDPYERLLAYVFRRSDGLFVNLTMAADGFANTLSIPPNVTFAEDMAAAVSQARGQGLGLWKACPDPDTLFS